MYWIKWEYYEYSMESCDNPPKVQFDADFYSKTLPQTSAESIEYSIECNHKSQ